MLNKMKIGTRLALGFGAVILASVAAVGAAVVAGRAAQAETAAVAETAQQRVELLNGMLQAQLSLVSSIRNAALQTDSGEMNREADAYKQVLAEMRLQEAELAGLDLHEEARASLERAIDLRTQAEPLAAEALNLALSYAAEEAAKVLTQRFAPVQAKWTKELRQLSTQERERAAADGAAIAAQVQRRGWWLLVTLAVVTLGVIGFAVLLTRSVTRPLRAAAATATRVAQGELDLHIEEVQGRDEAAELLRALQAMVVQLSTMVKAVRESSDSIGSASVEISSGNTDLSSRTERTAASLQQTSAALDALTGIVADNAGHARQAQTVADETGRVAAQGDQAMREVQGTMQGISDSSRRIGEIIGVIDGIAFQTNILALNAAVEAARAGEQGRGFAVVASEVRALAQRVTSAAGEVRSLIGESVQRVDEGSRLVNTMGGTMKELEGGVRQVHDLISSIAAAATDQDERLREVSLAVREIDGTTQQNAALVEEVAAASQSLSGQTERLGELVKQFRLASA